MKKGILEDVMKFLIPHFKFLTTLIVSQNREKLESLKQRIIEGKEKGYIKFHPDFPNLDLDLNKLKDEKGQEWLNILEKQLNIIVETIEKI